MIKFDMFYSNPSTSAMYCDQPISKTRSFDTKSHDVVDTCRDVFNCLPAESVIANHRCKFLGKEFICC